MAADGYDKRAGKRRADHERRLMGESLSAFHDRETAAPPSLAKIYSDNRRDQQRCTATADLFEAPDTKKGPVIADRPLNGARVGSGRRPL